MCVSSDLARKAQGSCLSVLFRVRLKLRKLKEVVKKNIKRVFEASYLCVSNKAKLFSNEAYLGSFNVQTRQGVRQVDENRTVGLGQRI